MISRACSNLHSWGEEHLQRVCDQNQFIDCGDYWLSTASQGSDAWLGLREYRLTMSKLAAAAGFSRFTSREHLLDLLSGKIKETFSEEQKRNMQRGTDLEPKARRYYQRSKKVVVAERGLIVPKWNPWIGASVDGDVIDSEGIIEIKCPKATYAPIMRFEALRLTNRDLNPKDYMWIEHFCQIQGCMAITGKKWCDYVVYTPADPVANKDGTCAILRIDFDFRFWTEVLYPQIQLFLQDLQVRLGPEVCQQMIPSHALTFKQLAQLYSIWKNDQKKQKK